MFCPYCGVSNDRGEAKCFVCEKPMPNLDVPATAPAGGRTRGQRETAQSSSQVKLAAVGDRMIALIFDRVLVFSIMVVVAAWATSSQYQVPSSVTGALTVAGAFVLITFLYHFLAESMFLTTIGKAAMGLHVAVEGGHNRAASIALRNVLRIVDAIGGYAVGFFFATFGIKRQRVGDLVGHTVVVDWPIARGGRAAVMLLLVLIAAASIWMASMVCPSCGASVTQQLGSLR